MSEDKKENSNAPKPLGTDPAALTGNDSKAEFWTHKDAEKAEKAQQKK